MAHLILYSAVSLDGFIAREDGSIDWLPEPASGNDFGYAAFLESVGSTVMGYSTYKQVLGFGEFPYKDKSNYVLTRRADPDNNGYVRFVREDPAAYIRGLKQEENRDIWLVGGGQTNHFMLRHDLVDRMILFIIPVSLGAGIILFAGQGIERKWKLTQHRLHEGSTVELRYDRT